MSIRKRLASFFVLMTGLLIIMGGLLLVGGPIIVEAFRQSLDSMNYLDAIRDVRSNITRQRTSLNRYLLFGDQQELLSFEESSRSAKLGFESIKKYAGKNQPAWYGSLLDLYNSTDASAKQVTIHYKKGNIAKAFEEATVIFEKLLAEVSSLEKEKALEAQQMFERIKQMITFVESAVLFSLVFAFVAGVLLFFSLYRAVMNPLETLRNGADAFGRGQWDHRIDLPSANEFGKLATSFNNMAENVKQLQMQAVHMDRMSAVGQLAGGVAHEINNPLTAVLGQAQILLARLKENDPAFGQLQKIEQAALRCKKIVRGLLDFSRPSQSTFEDIEMNNVLAATMELCEADLKRAKVNVELKPNKSVPVIQGNPSELQQVLLNLFNNAIQAMPKGGTLNLDLRTSNEAVTFKDRKIQGPWLEVVVRDTGIGIPKDHLGRVFEPFFTTKEIGKGTGLGLAVSLGIVQKHGGDLKVESLGTNKGATFIIMLPIKRAKAAPRMGMAA